MSEVILVDPANQVLGRADKLLVHTGSGQLHRAFSVFVLSPEGDLLIQQRATSKYHFGGLWSNTVCSHPEPDETTREAAEKRLAFEMGLELPLREAFTFQYRAKDPKTKLVEWEIDHVFLGTPDEQPTPNAEEVNAWGWITPGDLALQMSLGAEAFTPWFPIAVRELWSRGVLKNE